MTPTVAPEQLLSRDSQPVYGFEAQALIAGKTILVTGAGGSIGSEIVRQCVRLGARRIIKVDADENALFKLSLDLFGQALFRPEDDLYLIDVTDAVAVNALMDQVRPDIVFHAAAKKHLPLLQAEPTMAIRVNVLGTRTVVKAAVAHRVPSVVNISTDKAADPSSMLGWSKRLAELIGAGYDNGTTRVSSVRFGNVLGSNGSLLPAIQYRLDKGLPMQITHPDVTRYFMTIPEASGLVIEAARMSVGGEVFVLDMGQPVKIIDLINNFARLSDRPLPMLQVVGLRPGEKLHEDLFSAMELYGPTAHPRINMALVSSPLDVDAKLAELTRLLATTADREVLRQALTLTSNRKDDDCVVGSSARTAAVLGAH